MRVKVIDLSNRRGRVVVVSNYVRTVMRRVLPLLLAVSALGIGSPVQAVTDFFTDDNDSVHEANINRIAELGITLGCNPPTNDKFCPNDFLTRGQMASFLSRALNLPLVGADFFVDDDASVHHTNINKIADVGITKGCNPPTNDQYCPSSSVTRGQMASFLKRAASLDSASFDFFTDDSLSVHEGSINAIASVGITLGCNPPTNDEYCPNDRLTRAQMATFLARLLAIVTPVVKPISDVTMAEGDTLNVAVSVESLRDTVGFNLSLPSFGGFVDNGDGTGTITFAPAFDDAGSYSITLTAIDGFVENASDGSFTLTVTDVNHAPVLAPVGDQSSGEGAIIAVETSATDQDPDNTLSFSATGLPLALSMNSSTGEITGIIDASAAGVYSVTVTVSDGIVSDFEDLTWVVVDTNRNPLLDPLADITSDEGDTGISVTVTASDPESDNLTFSATGLPPGISIDVMTGTMSTALSDTSGGVYSVTVTVTDDGTPFLTAAREFTWTVFAPSALISVNAIGSETTQSIGAIKIVNTSAGGLQIVDVSIDMSTALFPDIVWDPEGKAGDLGWQCVLADGDGGASTGFIAGPTVRPCSEPFSEFHNGADDDEGFDVLTVMFTDFDETEEFTFSVETDPTSLKNSSGAGLVGGLDMIGSIVTVEFSNGDVLTAELFNIDGTFSASQTFVEKNLPSRPIVDVTALVFAETSWSSAHAGHTGTVVGAASSTSASQTVRIAGTVGEDVLLIVVESVLNASPGFDIDAFEANAQKAIDVIDAVIGVGGTVDIVIDTSIADRLYYITAVVVDSDGDPMTDDPTGATSNILIIDTATS